MLKLECQWRRIRNLNQVRDLRRFEGETAGRSRRLLLVDLLDTSRDGFVFVPGKASLFSQTFNRDPLVPIENEGGASQFIKLKLRAKPPTEAAARSGWTTA